MSTLIFAAVIYVALDRLIVWSNERAGRKGDPTLRQRFRHWAEDHDDPWLEPDDCPVCAARDEFLRNN